MLTPSRSRLKMLSAASVFALPARSSYTATGPRSSSTHPTRSRSSATPGVRGHSMQRTKVASRWTATRPARRFPGRRPVSTSTRPSPSKATSCAATTAARWRSSTSRRNTRTRSPSRFLPVTTASSPRLPTSIISTNASRSPARSRNIRVRRKWLWKTRRRS